jgi:ATP-dependent Clp protease ATP-binding subunit ClpA
MFERFTDAARRVIVLAQEESRRREHPEIDAGHLLLGALQADRILGLDDGEVDTLRHVAEESLAGKQQRRHGRDGHIPFAAPVQAAVDAAAPIAFRSNRNEITPADLLLAALEQPPLDELLHRERVDLPGLRARLTAAPARPTTGGSAATQDQDAQVIVLLEEILQRLDNIADQLRNRDR